MSEFFVRRPIVAIVIAILMTLIGGVCILALPIAQYPQIAPPEIQVQTHYTGADALTIEQSVAAPIEQQMSGVDDMNYMYSINANSGDIRLIVDFGVATDPNIDQVLTQLRVSQAQSQLPADVNNYGVTVKKSTTAPLMLIALYSPKGSYDGVFLANYAYINLVDQLTRVPGIGNVAVFGAGQYAMRLWVKPDQLAKLGITVPDIISAVQKQNNVNPAGQVGGEPIPSGQKFTYTVRAQGRLQTPEEFGEIVVRANPDGSFVRVKDIARIDLGAQTYNLKGRLNGQPSAILACYQLPGTNAVKAAQGVRKLMAEAKQRFPADMDYAVSLDQTLSVTEGLRDIVKTLFEALALVVVVVFIFLQGWRATLIPLCAVPVSLIGTFVLFPLFGFSINSLSLFGLVLAIGLVVDDAIVVVEAVERHIEEGMSVRDCLDRDCPVDSYRKKIKATFISHCNCPMHRRSNGPTRPRTRSKTFSAKFPAFSTPPAWSDSVCSVSCKIRTARSSSLPSSLGANGRSRKNSTPPSRRTLTNSWPVSPKVSPSRFRRRRFPAWARPVASSSYW